MKNWRSRQWLAQGLQLQHFLVLHLEKKKKEKVNKCLIIAANSDVLEELGECEFIIEHLII